MKPTDSLIKRLLYQMLLEFLMALIPNNTVLCLYSKIFHNIAALIAISIPVVGESKKKLDYMVVITWVITKLLPSRQIVHSTQQVVYLAHANMHTNHLLVYSGCHYCKQVL